MKTFNLDLNHSNLGARGLARIGHRPPKPGVAGSNPAGPAKTLLCDFSEQSSVDVYIWSDVVLFAGDLLSLITFSFQRKFKGYIYDVTASNK